MLNCKSCIKNDVCGKKERIKELVEKLVVNQEYQGLKNENIELNVKCNNFREETKILR